MYNVIVFIITHLLCYEFVQKKYGWSNLRSLASNVFNWILGYSCHGFFLFVFFNSINPLFEFFSIVPRVPISLCHCQLMWTFFFFVTSVHIYFSLSVSLSLSLIFCQHISLSYSLCLRLSLSYSLCQRLSVCLSHSLLISIYTLASSRYSSIFFFLWSAGKVKSTSWYIHFFWLKITRPSLLAGIGGSICIWKSQGIIIWIDKDQRN